MISSYFMWRKREEYREGGREKKKEREAWRGREVERGKEGRERGEM